MATLIDTVYPSNQRSIYAFIFPIKLYILANTSRYNYVNKLVTSRPFQFLCIWCSLDGAFRMNVGSTVEEVTG